MAVGKGEGRQESASSHDLIFLARVRKPLSWLSVAGGGSDGGGKTTKGSNQKGECCRWVKRGGGRDTCSVGQECGHYYQHGSCETPEGSISLSPDCHSKCVVVAPVEFVLAQRDGGGGLPRWVRGLFDDGLFFRLGSREGQM